jgi:uncharacterized membrane protein YphA (DoxX/SURF4 family)
MFRLSEISWIANVMMSGVNDEVILGARLFLAPLFLIFGWRKLRDYPAIER